MVLLFSFFFCSGGFLVAHASEPYAPKYVTGSINFRNGENLNRTAGAASGSYYYHLPGLVVSSSGEVYYQVWQEHTFDLSQLDGWFSGLMAAVRLATSVVVVGAVIHYTLSFRSVTKMAHGIFTA